MSKPYTIKVHRPNGPTLTITASTFQTASRYIAIERGAPGWITLRVAQII